MIVSIEETPKFDAKSTFILLAKMYIVKQLNVRGLSEAFEYTEEEWVWAYVYARVCVRARVPSSSSANRPPCC